MATRKPQAEGAEKAPTSSDVSSVTIDGTAAEALCRLFNDRNYTHEDRPIRLVLDGSTLIATTDPE